MIAASHLPYPAFVYLARLIGRDLGYIFLSPPFAFLSAMSACLGTTYDPDAVDV